MRRSQVKPLSYLKSHTVDNSAALSNEGFVVHTPDQSGLLSTLESAQMVTRPWQAIGDLSRIEVRLRAHWNQSMWSYRKIAL